MAPGRYFQWPYQVAPEDRALVVTFTAGPAWAHPGGLAADGCHYCRTNCAKWGEVEGARHCHRERQKARARQNGQPPARHPQATQDRIRNIPIEIRDNAPRIVDADTLEMAGPRVRLQGIDASDPGGPFLGWRDMHSVAWRPPHPAAGALFVHFAENRPPRIAQDARSRLGLYPGPHQRIGG